METNGPPPPPAPSSPLLAPPAPLSSTAPSPHLPTTPDHSHSSANPPSPSNLGLHCGRRGGGGHPQMHNTHLCKTLWPPRHQQQPVDHLHPASAGQQLVQT
ncbi:hypothetical protein PCASD_06906 [Puccinia coronata f. sp. avenae]|uniref:Uncharacterized protein n=1 Tax=Puccinia coronata f. sp. avenae TaxID=200324 RepID=A0A2N5V4U3_9BASI|nr:hypothetical protein PCASD_06906 [Puccinia coronata f. sp. avenae]